MSAFPISLSVPWRRLYTRLTSFLSGSIFKTCASFWLFGLINNLLYVIILSAALDLVGPSIPKGIVLLADVFPSVLVKLVAPYFIHAVPYSLRIIIFAALSVSGMLLIALTPASTDARTVAVKLAGVALASLSSGGGELSFLGLTHFYGHSSLAAWSSGTGGAGVVGAGAYVLATTSLGLTSRTSLIAFAFLPIIMLVSFFAILPERPVMKNALLGGAYQRVAADDDDTSVDSQPQRNAETSDDVGDHDSVHPVHAASLPPPKSNTGWKPLKANLIQARALFWPYMLPLLLVYIAEYTINQGVAPTLLFPLQDTPFHAYRDFYPTYNAVYQVGVFISRSSTPFIRVHVLYAPSIFQVVNLAVLTLHAIYGFLPNVWLIFAILFWEGLLGGLVYVNTFAEITDNVAEKDREFSLSATTVSDSGGICLAAFISMGFETWLCEWQISHGRDYCRRT